MSFSFSYAGPREKVLGAIDDFIARHMSPTSGNDSSQAKRARDYIASELELYPNGKVLFVKANGHHSVSKPWKDNAPDPEVTPIYTGNVSVSVSEYGDVTIV